MTSSTFIRQSGLASMLGGILFAAKMWYDRNDGPPWPTDITDTLIFVVPLLWLVGLTGLYARCKERSGGLGLLGFGVASTGAAMAVVGPLAMSLFDNDGLWFVLVLGLIILFTGLIITGIATIRAKALLGWSAALPLIIGTLGLLMFFANPDDPRLSVDMVSLLRSVRMISTMLFGAVWIVLGYTLWSEPSAAAVQAKPSVT
ncbi:MAG: hypothetical protein M3R24_15465 [Chloroflexota bacterium]|nr:hypothetical protein [Chloroflexota bacterium]PLS81320.1 MAG: hypothetical protein CYG59_06120 [Chloroflexota bacterium]